MLSYLSSFLSTRATDNAAPKEVKAPIPVESNWGFLNPTLMQSTTEFQSDVVGWVSKLEEDDSSKEMREVFQKLLEEKEKEIKNLKNELNFMYSYAANNYNDDEVFQTCESCGVAFDYNHDFACAYHRGTIVGKTFAEHPESVISAFHFDHITDPCPESLWYWSCCNSNANEPGCIFRRHVPVAHEEQELLNSLHPERKDTLKKYFHPTDSIVLYESTIQPS